MSLLTICSNAIKELSGFELPTSFYGNANLTARSCVALVSREMKTLEREYRWSELITTATFSTVSGTDAYSLPTDFRAFANASQWDRTNHRYLSGPTSPLDWQWLKGDLATGATIQRFFRIQGQYIYIHPVPTVSGDTIAFDYYSKHTVTKQEDGSNVEDWTSDNDTSRLDEDLLTMGLKWRFLQSKGMPFETEYREYETIKESARDDNGGKAILNMGRGRIRVSNLPETGFGS